jgi:hypothetical protein
MKSGVLPIVDITRQAHWIGERLRAAGAAGFVSTLSPRVVLDSGYALDLRFAPGPFLYRSAILLSSDRLDRLHAIAPQNLVRSLDDNPPAAIIVGAVAELEDGLRKYAVARRYRLETSPFGTYQLYIRPR